MVTVHIEGVFDQQSEIMSGLDAVWLTRVQDKQCHGSRAYFNRKRDWW